MSPWQGMLLGLVQGFTEFLPISSSGHLVVAEAALGLSPPGITVEVTLHVATLLAVVIAYRAQLGTLVRGAVRGGRTAWRYVALLAVATVPAGVVGVVFGEALEGVFHSLVWVGVDFVVTGWLLWSTRTAQRRAAAMEPSVAGAGGIGVAQAVAILPGISRSGTTIAAAMWLGVEPVRAAEFSFLMAIPAIAGAAVLQVPHMGADMVGVGVWPLAVSFAAALVSGILAIRLLVTLLARRAFHRFAPYCWVVGAVTILWSVAR